MADLLGPFAPLQLRERISAQARNIRIEVRPDGTVLLVIPRRVSRAAAYAFLRSREDWIRRKLVELQSRVEQIGTRGPLRWDGSDTLPLRGVEMPLRIVVSRIVKPRVRFDDDQITMFCTSSLLARPAFLSNVLRGEFRKLARQEAKQLLDEESARLGVDYHGPRIADQKSLWGSCTPDGLISLNWRLLLAPPPVLRYVIVHELCHRQHLDHSQRFWRLVARQMPDHADWRGWLREHGAGLHVVLPKTGRDAAPAGLFDDAL